MSSNVDERLFLQYRTTLGLYLDLVGYATFNTLGLELYPDIMQRAVQQMQDFIAGNRDEPVTDESLDMRGEGDYSNDL